MEKSGTGLEGLELNSRAYFLGSLGDAGSSGVAVSGSTAGMTGSVWVANFALGAEAAEEPVPVASLTKIMTAFLTIKSRELDETVTITPEMLAGLEEFAVIGLEVGQVATVEDLLYATMLPSAGDAAQALAISGSGSIAKFAQWMNEVAAEIGMKNTHFSNPVGLDEDNYSTAADIAILLREAMKEPVFAEILGTYERELPSIGKTARKTFAEMEYVQGGKTGYTNAAGRCFASVAEVEGQRYILVTTGAPTEGALHLADAATVYRALEENYEPVRIIAAGDELVQVRVEGSPTKALKLVAPSDVVVALPNGVTKEDLTYSYDGPTEIRRETETAEVTERGMGTYRVSYGERTLAQKGFALHESCAGMDSSCVVKPEFYDYSYVAIGGAVSLVLLGVTVWGFVQGFGRGSKASGGGQSGGSGGGRAGSGRGSKVSGGSRTFGSSKVLKWASLAALVVSVVVNVVIFAGWFVNNEQTEVYEPEIVRLDAEAGSEGSEGSEEAPGENSEVGATSGTGLASGTNGAGGLTTEVAGNCTTGYGNLMLINPNFTVGEDFIAARRNQLISVSQTYGIPEYHAAGNGDNLMIPEAAAHLSEMIAAYEAENPGHEIGTYSCFRARGTSCGRLCAATGTSDHHTGLTCDLIDLQYGSVLTTDDYANHKEWQWLRANSYKYGFIDRFPEAWAGGLMSEPLNVDANGSTGLFETWHYRYVGVTAATEIATGKYNNGHYDSLEHYLKMIGKVQDLKAGRCE